MAMDSCQVHAELHLELGGEKEDKGNTSFCFKNTCVLPGLFAEECFLLPEKVF